VTIQVIGVSGQDALLLKFPSNVEDNAEFTYTGLDAEGAVNDGDAADLDADTDEVEVNYEIVAPSAPGSYTLEAFAAQHTPNGISVTLTVTVTQPAGPGPVISMINGTPTIPLDTESVTVVANVTSEVGIDEVRLQYSTDNGTSWTNQTMTLSGGFYEGTIPALALETHVTYRVVAIDTDGTEAVSWETEYTVGDIPVPPAEPVIQLHYGWYLGFPALALAYIGTALEYYDEERFTKIHGIMLGLAYILTSINVLWLFFEDPAVWSAMNPELLFSMASMLSFVHAWHIWLGILSMIFGTLAFITHLGGWKTCNLGLPAVILWTILGLTGMYIGIFYRM
jgi:hypothetical protein